MTQNKGGFMRPRLGLVLALTLLALPSLVAEADEPGPKGIAFFEQKIRPVLVAQCYSCHSDEALRKDKLRGGLRVDSREGLLRGGDTGPAVVPGNLEESYLLAALRYDDLVQMPPEGKLPDAVIADFEAWVKQGAPDPRDERPSVATTNRGIDIEAGRKHWAYQPPRQRGLPTVQDESWPSNAIDRFVLAKLEGKGLRPVKDADRATLVRRVYFDLIGLPPTPEEIDAFDQDRSPTAYEDLVDRLLGSPRFGERWGRHWLDVARFAESLTLRGFIMKPAWRYRDYVIDAFNQDLPYDQFVKEQVAGDLMPTDLLEERRRRLIATTFLVLGNTNLEDQDKEQLRMDVVDEQLDTIGKAFLAQTIGCARCHDHKFDPIPARDYYALAGALRNTKTLEHANVSKWLEAPLPVEPEREAALKAHEERVAELEARIKAEKARLLAQNKSSARPGVVRSGDLPGIVLDESHAKKVGEWKLSRHSGSFIDDGYLHDLDAGKGEKSLTFEPEVPRAGLYDVWLAYSPGANRAASVPVTVLSADGERVIDVNMKAEPPIDGRFLSLGRHRFESKNQGYVLISNQGTKGHVTVDAVIFLPAEAADARAKAGATNAQPVPPVEDRTALKALESDLARLRESGPERELVATVQEEAEIGETRIHVRGSVHTLGEEVPRGFLQVATIGPAPAMPSDQSGRRELGEWLASGNNPLTARVFVNRAWHWLFGSGLVRTTDNFGTTGEAPSHPELLDDLAVRFMTEDRWSMKALVRRIVLSRTYRLASVDVARALRLDPENRLVWRHDRRRLDAECIRDALLSVSGQLRLDMRGPTYPPSLNADYGFTSADTRRSVYAPVFRNALPEVFEVFDFADPSMVTGRRNVSTVAPQALFFLNNPLVREQSRLAARRVLDEPGLDTAERLARAYRLVLGRPPSRAERDVAIPFLDNGGDGAWPALMQSLFASLDFRYVN